MSNTLEVIAKVTDCKHIEHHSMQGQIVKLEKQGDFYQYDLCPGRNILFKPNEIMILNDQDHGQISQV